MSAEHSFPVSDDVVPARREWAGTAEKQPGEFLGFAYQKQSRGADRDVIGAHRG